MEEKRGIVPGYPLEDYLQGPNSVDWSEDTRSHYRRVLYDLQKYLEEHGPPTPQTLQVWQRDLQQRGYGQRSVNIRISAANNYFRWCGRHELVMHHQPTEPVAQPELTRGEYLQLLRTARRLGRHKLYLQVKLFAVTGLPLQCLEQLTVAVVQAGGAVLDCRSTPYTLRLPDPLRGELLDYLAENGITAGPVFVTRSGRPVDRSNLCRNMQELCREAGVAEEKGNPRCLRNLFRATQDNLYASLEQQLQQVYDMQLRAEQESIGWSLREQG